jgi:hypothetical protein
LPFPQIVMDVIARKRPARHAAVEARKYQLLGEKSVLGAGQPSQEQSADPASASANRTVTRKCAKRDEGQR